MKGFDPKWAIGFNIAYLICGLVAGGAIKFVAIPQTAVDIIQTTAYDVSMVLAAVNSVLGLWSSPRPGPLVGGSVSPGKALMAALAPLLVAYALLSGSPAKAADNTPAPAGVAAINQALASGSTCTPTSCTGFYAGFGLGGNGSNANIIGNGINGSVFAGGVLPFADAGYLYRQGNWLMGAELGAGYQLVSGVSVNGVGANENGFWSYQVVKAGGDVSALFGGQAPITVPPQLANALISLYAQIGIAEHRFAGFWATGLASGAGALFDIGPHSFIDLSYMNIQYNAPAGALLTPGPANIVKVGFNYKF